MKSRKHIKSKHKADKKELCVFSTTTDRQKSIDNSELHNASKRQLFIVD